MSKKEIKVNAKFKCYVCGKELKEWEIHAHEFGEIHCEECFQEGYCQCHDCKDYHNYKEE